MKVHFDPYADPDLADAPERAPCGTLVGFDYLASNQWNQVTCGKCLIQKDKLSRWFENTETEIINQMGDMADFFEQENNQ